MIQGLVPEGAAAAAPWLAPPAATDGAPEGAPLVTFADLLKGTVGAADAPAAATTDAAPATAFSIEALWLQLLARQTQPASSDAPQPAPEASADRVEGDAVPAAETGSQDDDAVVVDLTALLAAPQPVAAPVIVETQPEPAGPAIAADDAQGAKGEAPVLRQAIAAAPVDPQVRQAVKPTHEEAPESAEPATTAPLTAAPSPTAVNAATSTSAPTDATAVVDEKAPQAPVRAAQAPAVPAETEKIITPRRPVVAAATRPSVTEAATVAAQVPNIQPSPEKARPEPGTAQRPERAEVSNVALNGPAIADAFAGAQQESTGGQQQGSNQQTAPVADVLTASARAAEGTPFAAIGAAAVEAPAAAAAQATAPASPMTPAAAHENLTRIIESFKLQYKQGVPEATIKLNPEQFGEVTISIRVDRGAVSAVLHADTAEAQQWLAAHEDKFRSGLADQGLNLERFVVQRDRQEAPREQRRQGQAPARYRQKPEESAQRFEVTV